MRWPWRRRPVESGHIETADVYVTGSGQRLVGVHSRAACQGRHCVVHNPSDHPMRGFPTLWRRDRGIMERICPHGVGHPDPDDIDYIERICGSDAARVEIVHGCDGCCAGSYVPRVKKP